MILDKTLKLEAVLAAGVAANQPECHVFYKDWNPQGTTSIPAPKRTALNSGTDVTILAAPVNNPAREVIGIHLYNKDTASVTVTIKTDDGTTEFILIKATLATLEMLGWEPNAGWYAMTSAGGRK